MAGTRELIALRNGIDDLINESFKKKSGRVLSTDDFLKEVRKRLGREIAAAECELLEIALKRLIDSVGRRKAGRQRTEGELDLFSEYPNIPQTLIVGDSKRKRIEEMSISEVEKYIVCHSPKAISERNEALKRMVNDLIPFRDSSEDTIEELVKKKNKSLVGDGKSAFDWSSEHASKSSEDDMVSAS